MVGGCELMKVRVTANYYLPYRMALKSSSSSLTQSHLELNQTKHKSWLRFRMIWGRKRLAEGLPAPSLGVPDIYIPSDAQRKVVAVEDGDVQRQMAIAKEPPLVEVYYTQEELKRRVAEREAVRGPFPPPLVLKFNSVPS